MAPLRVLLLEDHEADADLLVAALRQAGFTPVAQRVDSEAAYLAALPQTPADSGNQPDLILADYHLPQFDAPRALQLLKSRQLDIPFIVVTGNLGEEPVVECLKQGAADYLLKDRLARLGPAVVNALHAKHLRDQNRRAETVQSAIYRISEAAQSAPSLNHLYHALHRIIGELMPARNFYIALYDSLTTVLTFPYYADQYDTVDPATPAPLGRGLTEYVLRTGQPLLVPPEKFKELAAAGEVERVGTDSIDWIGVPLRTPAGILGVVVVQTYAESVRLTETHKDILVFVSAQIAMAIERKRAEERLRESEERFRVLAENIPGVIYLRRNDARYSMIYLNDEVEYLTGYPKEDFLTDHLSFVELYHPDDAPKIQPQVNQALAAGHPFHLIYRLRHRSGEWRWVEEWGTTVYLDGPERFFLEGFISDITDRRQAEEALQQAQKMESLGILAGGVAHDFNNLLVAMLGQTSLALARLLADPVAARENIEKAVKAAERAADLTRQLLAYSGRGQFAIRSIQLNELIQENVSLFEVPLPKPVSLRTQLLPGLPLVEGDAGQMQQIIMNLVINAAEAIGQRPGTITVQTGLQTITSADTHWWQYIGEPLPAGGYVLLQVEDDGGGMEAATLANIFDPFFTTKFTGRGLGLAAVLGIVRGHHGGLHVISEVGRGTRFQLLFPVHLAPTEPMADQLAESAALTRPAARQTILVIDDEAPVREAVSDILDLEGVPVLTAANGALGLDLYRQRQAEVCLILLDLSMPGLSGEETFYELRRINPEVRVVLSSGYSQTETARRFADQPVAGFLQKPYDVEALIAEVWRHLR